MGLRIVIRPGSSFTIGENKITNTTKHKADLLIEGPDRVEREDWRQKPLKEKEQSYE